jgi:hypothetical protein
MKTHDILATKTVQTQMQILTDLGHAISSDFDIRDAIQTGRDRWPPSLVLDLATQDQDLQDAAKAANVTLAI